MIQERFHCVRRPVVYAGALLLATAMRVQADRIVFEAESAVRIEPPMRVVRAAELPEDAKFVPGASGDAYIEIPDGAGNPPEVTAGKAEYTVEITKAGVYVLWCRVYWEDSCGNSFTVQINDGPPFSFGQTGTYKAWHWVRSPPRIAVLNLPKGTHQLRFLNREDGIRIDQVVLSNHSDRRERRFVPVDIESVTVPAP